LAFLATPLSNHSSEKLIKLAQIVMGQKIDATMMKLFPRERPKIPDFSHLLEAHKSRNPNIYPYPIKRLLIATNKTQIQSINFMHR
jgi:hypothetical protein